MVHKNTDNFIIDFSNEIVNLNKLRSCQTNLKISKKFRTTITKLYKILRRRNKIGTDQNLWIELYTQSTYIYSDIKKIGNIPISIVTKHNHIVPFYMRQKISEINTTILHFDTHPDMNLIKKSGPLPNLYKKYLKTGNEKYIKQAQEIVWDIGAAISGTLMTIGAQNYIWCMPEWIPDQNVEILYSIKYNKRDVLLITNDEEHQDDPLCDILYDPKNFEEENSCIYAKIQTGKVINKNKHSKKSRPKNTKKSLDMILDIFEYKREEKEEKEERLNEISQNYILDIDLDYFVCNGEKFEKEQYFKEPYDLASKKRTKTIFVNENNPRDTYLETEELEKYNLALEKELEEINKRISVFFKIIKGLYKKGYTPSHITISDSTNIEFSELCHCNSVSNGYVPKYFALFLNQKIQEGLKKIFEK